METKKPVDAVSLLKEKGIKPSFIRVRILSYIMSTKEHPSAETIYDKLSPQIPTLSKTSVYNTLKLFVEKGLLLEINLHDNESRFDGDCSFHGHFLCVGCKNLEDIQVSCNGKCVDKIKDGDRIILNYQIILQGYCSDCKKRKDRSNVANMS